MKEIHKDQLSKLFKPKQPKGTTMMVARIRRERERGRGQVRAPAVLEIITRMKKLTRKVEGITKGARRNSTRKGFSVITIKKWGHFADECRNKRVPRNADEAQLAQDEDSDFDKVLLMATTNS